MANATYCKTSARRDAGVTKQKPRSPRLKKYRQHWAGSGRQNPKFHAIHCVNPKCRVRLSEPKQVDGFNFCQTCFEVYVWRKASLARSNYKLCGCKTKAECNHYK